jgi:hypothetical protein
MEMIRKRETLKLIAERTKEGKQTSFRSLVREFWSSDEAACGHVRRLWGERLIECTEYRPYGYEYGLQKGESIRDLSFRLSRRGRQRLEWYAEQERREQEELW